MPSRVTSCSPALRTPDDDPAAREPLGVEGV